jgi:hypothetical protein
MMTVGNGYVKYASELRIENKSLFSLVGRILQTLDNMFSNCRCKMLLSQKYGHKITI